MGRDKKLMTFFKGQNYIKRTYCWPFLTMTNWHCNGGPGRGFLNDVTPDIVIKESMTWRSSLNGA